MEEEEEEEEWSIEWSWHWQPATDVNSLMEPCIASTLVHLLPRFYVRSHSFLFFRFFLFTFSIFTTSLLFIRANKSYRNEVCIFGAFRIYY